MFEFKKPDWLKNDLGKVSQRIGTKGFIEIDRISNKIVFLKLIKQDGSYEILPASIALSELLILKKVKPLDLKDCDIFELTTGYICISQTISFEI